MRQMGLAINSRYSPRYFDQASVVKSYPLGGGSLHWSLKLRAHLDTDTPDAESRAIGIEMSI